MNNGLFGCWLAFIVFGLVFYVWTSPTVRMWYRRPRARKIWEKSRSIK